MSCNMLITNQFGTEIYSTENSTFIKTVKGAANVQCMQRLDYGELYWTILDNLLMGTSWLQHFIEKAGAKAKR